MAGALRSAILRQIRVPPRPPTPFPPALLRSSRLMSSHDDHLDRHEVIDRVLSVVKSFPKVDPFKVTPDVHFQKDLGLDSLDNVEIVMALEEEFKLEIPDKEADKIDSCKVAIDYIASHPMAGLFHSSMARYLSQQSSTGSFKIYDLLYFPCFCCKASSPLQYAVSNHRKYRVCKFVGKWWRSTLEQLMVVDVRASTSSSCSTVLPSELERKRL